MNRGGAKRFMVRSGGVGGTSTIVIAATTLRSRGRQSAPVLVDKKRRRDVFPWEGLRHAGCNSRAELGATGCRLQRAIPDKNCRPGQGATVRSEEHTSELQSRLH